MKKTDRRSTEIIVGLKREVAQLTEAVASARKVAQIAMRDAMTNRETAMAICNAAAAAHRCLNAGLLRPADTLMGAIQEMEASLLNRGNENLSESTDG